MDAFLTEHNVFAFKYNTAVLCIITLSCLISVSVNFSTFLVIGKTSPVTYQVLGHLKTCLVLAFGYILLRNPFSWRNVFGIGIAVVGMGLYSYISVQESQKKANEAASQLPQVVKEMEVEPLLEVDIGSNPAKEDSTPVAPLWSIPGSEKDLQA